MTSTCIDTRLGNFAKGRYAPQTKLDVNGTTQIATPRITGGANHAEHNSVNHSYPLDEFNAEQRFVVFIDPCWYRRFTRSCERYDYTCVGHKFDDNGVPPGVILNDVGNPAVVGDQPIALTGQDSCRADASFGPITPGDLHTTSGTLGHAMKATDDTRARFAVLGQAMTELPSGRGWVQVLVGKQ